MKFQSSRTRPLSGEAEQNLSRDDILATYHLQAAVSDATTNFSLPVG
jgi:hypothetical protein